MKTYQESKQSKNKWIMLLFLTIFFLMIVLGNKCYANESLGKTLKINSDSNEYANLYSAKKDTVPNVSTDLKSVATWSQVLSAHLNKYKKYPIEAKGLPNSTGVVIKAIINDQGKVTSVKIIKSSGNVYLDNAAQLLLETASPVPAPSAEVLKGEKEVTVNVPIRYAVDNIDSRSTWLYSVLLHLNKYKHYPSKAKKTTGVVLVSATINKQGKATLVKIVRSSGDIFLDNAAQSLLEKASPVPVPPAEILNGREEVTVSIPISYNLK